MASGDTLAVFTALHNVPPGGTRTPATLDVRGGTNDIKLACLDFDDTADEYATFYGMMPRNYDDGGVTVYLHVAFTNDDDTGTPTAQFEAAFGRIGDAVQDIDAIAAGLAAAQDITITVPATIGHIDIGNVAFTNGAEMDSVAAGESFVLSIMCDASDSGHVNDSELYLVEIKET